MTELFFGFDGQKTCRIPNFLHTFPDNIEETHPGGTYTPKTGAISVVRALIPEKQCPFDKTIAEAFIRHAKFHAGTGSTPWVLLFLIHCKTVTHIAV